MRAATAAATNAVVAIWVELVPPIAVGAVGVPVSAGDASGAEVVSRVFVPEAGVDEDSVTGSAHAIIAAYWAARLGRNSFTAFQASRRGGHVGVTLEGDRAMLTGTARTVIEGEFIIG